MYIVPTNCLFCFYLRQWFPTFSRMPFQFLRRAELHGKNKKPKVFPVRKKSFTRFLTAVNSCPLSVVVDFFLLGEHECTMEAWERNLMLTVMPLAAEKGAGNISVWCLLYLHFIKCAFVHKLHQEIICGQFFCKVVTLMCLKTMVSDPRLIKDRAGVCSH